MSSIVKVRVVNKGFRSFKEGVVIDVDIDTYKEYSKCLRLVSNTDTQIDVTEKEDNKVPPPPLKQANKNLIKKK